MVPKAVAVRLGGNLLQERTEITLKAAGKKNRNYGKRQKSAEQPGSTADKRAPEGRGAAFYSDLLIFGPF
jgi:hypothetical protein